MHHCGTRENPATSLAANSYRGTNRNGHDNEDVQSVRCSAVNMLTCSLAFLSTSSSFCNLSALSSALSACSCNDLIFRFTASSDVGPAIVYSNYYSLLIKTLKVTTSSSTISEKMTRRKMTSVECAESAQGFVETLIAICPGSRSNADHKQVTAHIGAL